MMMKESELRELIALLEELLAVIGDADLRERDPDAQLARLRSVSESISAFHVAHRGGIPPRLNHFLENCSYQKALEWASAEIAAEL